MDSESVKTEVIKQVRTQYALSNTRELIEVRAPHSNSRIQTPPTC